jgi:hypothetical protein
MSLERGGVPEVLTKEAGPHAIFVSGGQGTYARIRGIYEGLKQAYGEKKVKVFNSILSKDPQDRTRWFKMKQEIQHNIHSGVHLVLHSLGSSEGRFPLKALRREGFFDKKENVDNMHITLVAPASPRGLLAPFRFLSRTIKLAREVGESPISKKYSLRRGIDSLTAFPPENMEDAALTQGVRNALDDLSQHRKNLDVIPFVAEQTYTDRLSVQQKAQVSEYDTLLKLAIHNNDHAAVRKFVAARGELLRKPLEQVDLGNYEASAKPIMEATKSTIGGYIALLRTITSAAFNFPLREMKILQRKGVKVDIIVPEYDMFKPADEAALDVGHKNVHVAERSGHAYLPLQAKRFAKSVRELYDGVRPKQLVPV